MGENDLKEQKRREDDDTFNPPSSFDVMIFRQMKEVNLATKIPSFVVDQCDEPEPPEEPPEVALELRSSRESFDEDFFEEEEDFFS